MEHFQAVWTTVTGTLAGVALTSWIMGAEFLVILVLLFLVWRQGRWMVRVNTRLIDNQEALAKRLTHSNEAVVSEMTTLVNRTIERFTDVQEEDE